MRTIKTFSLALIVILSVCAMPSGNNTYNLSKDYVVTINGTSNLHNWNETVGTVSGAGTINWNADGSFDLAAIKLEMNVYSIKSTEGSAMNNNTYKALKGEANPEIIIVLSGPLKSIQLKSNGTVIATKCNLTIAGVTKLIDMPVKISMLNHSKLEFDGTQTIKMTDYGIDPPTALFGALKTGNEITIKFKTSFTTSNN